MMGLNAAISDSNKKRKRQLYPRAHTVGHATVKQSNLKAMSLGCSAIEHTEVTKINSEVTTKKAQETPGVSCLNSSDCARVHQHHC